MRRNARAGLSGAEPDAAAEHQRRRRAGHRLPAPSRRSARRQYRPAPDAGAALYAHWQVATSPRHPAFGTHPAGRRPSAANLEGPLVRCPRPGARHGRGAGPAGPLRAAAAHPTRQLQRMARHPGAAARPRRAASRAAAHRHGDPLSAAAARRCTTGCASAGGRARRATGGAGLVRHRQDPGD